MQRLSLRSFLFLKVSKVSQVDGFSKMGRQRNAVGMYRTKATSIDPSLLMKLRFLLQYNDLDLNI